MKEREKKDIYEKGIIVFSVLERTKSAKKAAARVENYNFETC